MFTTTAVVLTIGIARLVEERTQDVNRRLGRSGYGAAATFPRWQEQLQPLPDHP